jgi:5-methyltetrahydrofolate--homocysteine methyltransferase
MAAGDFSRVEADARAQVAAGAQMLDVNAGIPLADEPAILAKAVQLVQSITDVPLSIDSSIVAALASGLAVYKGKPLVNSVTGEEERLESVLPLVKKYGAAVVAISNDETGISEDPDVRFEVAKKIVHRAADHGIPASDVVVDPLVMPVGAINRACVQVTHLLRRLKNELKVNTTCGASNISFGLPAREGITSAFLISAIGAGMTSAIMNPLHIETVKAVMGADVMMGHDPDCMRWIRKFREVPPAPASGAPGAAPAEGAARGRREGGHRRRVS